MKSELRTGGNGDVNPKDVVEMLIGFSIGINAYMLIILFYNTITYDDFSLIHLFGIIFIDVWLYYIIKRLYLYSEDKEGSHSHDSVKESKN